MQRRRNLKKPLLLAMLFALLMPTLSACYVYDYDRGYYRDRDYASRRDGYWRGGRYHYRDRDDDYWRDRYGRYRYRDRDYWRYGYRDRDYWYDRRYSWRHRDRDDD